MVIESEPIRARGIIVKYITLLNCEVYTQILKITLFFFLPQDVKIELAQRY